MMLPRSHLETARRHWPFSCRPLRILGICLVSGSLGVTACVPAQSISTPMPVSAPTPVSTLTVLSSPPASAVPVSTEPPTSVPSDVTRMRPYTEASVWNQPIGPAPTYDPHSAEMIATIGLGVNDRVITLPDSYGNPAPASPLHGECYA